MLDTLNDGGGCGGGCRGEGDRFGRGEKGKEKKIKRIPKELWAKQKPKQIKSNHYGLDLPVYAQIVWLCSLFKNINAFCASLMTEDETVPNSIVTVELFVERDSYK